MDSAKATDRAARGVGPNALFFDEFEVGQSWLSPRRTITEADIVMFAGMTGDYNPVHTDEEFAKRTPFGTRILHGPAVFAIATGLLFAFAARGFGRGPLWMTIPIGIAVSLVIWLIFAGLLKLALPGGPLEHLFL